MSTLLYSDLLYKNGKYELILSMDPDVFQSTRQKSRHFANFFDALILGSSYKVVRVLCVVDLCHLLQCTNNLNLPICSEHPGIIRASARIVEQY